MCTPLLDSPRRATSQLKSPTRYGKSFSALPTPTVPANLPKPTEPRQWAWLTKFRTSRWAREGYTFILIVVVSIMFRSFFLCTMCIPHITRSSLPVLFENAVIYPNPDTVHHCLPCVGPRGRWDLCRVGQGAFGCHDPESVPTRPGHVVDGRHSSRSKWYTPPITDR